MDKSTAQMDTAPVGAALSADQVRALVPGLGRAATYAWMRARLPVYEIGKKLYVHRLWLDLELLGLDSRRIHAGLYARLGGAGLLELVQEVERLAKRAPAAADPAGQEGGP